MSLRWTNERCDELEKLRQLLFDVASLDRGSNFLANVAKCIESADALKCSDLQARRVSFVSFLTNDCIADRQANMVKGEK